MSHSHSGYDSTPVQIIIYGPNAIVTWRDVGKGKGAV